MGVAYFVRVKKDNQVYDKYLAETFLTISTAIAVCGLCFGIGMNKAVSRDVSYEKLNRTQEAESNTVATATSRKKDSRSGRDKFLSAGFILSPCLAILVSGAMLGTVTIEIYPSINTITVCNRDENKAPTQALDRQCPFWGGKTPTRERYMRRCLQFKRWSCCTNEEADTIFEQNDWIERVKGDRYGEGECHAMLEALMCWPCSADQTIFYPYQEKDATTNVLDTTLKLRVCRRMCDTVYDVCRDSTFDHYGRTFSQTFSDSNSMCGYFNFESTEDCSCYEAYPGGDWATYTDVNFVSDAQVQTTTTTPTPAVV